MKKSLRLSRLSRQYESLRLSRLSCNPPDFPGQNVRLTTKVPVGKRDGNYTHVPNNFLIMHTYQNKTEQGTNFQDFNHVH